MGASTERQSPAWASLGGQHLPQATHLPVQATGDDADGACAPVDSKHEVVWVLWFLVMDGVSDHPIVGVDSIVLICGCHLHHRSAWRGGKSEYFSF
jgi:hypothetical protein